MSTEREERIAYWKKGAEDDFQVMKSLFSSGNYLWCLFLGHIVLEKLLKAIYVKRIKLDAPRLHDLTRIAKLAKLEMSDEQGDELDSLTKFCIIARYPDYKYKMHKVADKKYTRDQIIIIKRLRQWLLQQI